MVESCPNPFLEPCNKLILDRVNEKNLEESAYHLIINHGYIKVLLTLFMGLRSKVYLSLCSMTLLIRKLLLCCGKNYRIR